MLGATETAKVDKVRELVIQAFTHLIETTDDFEPEAENDKLFYTRCIELSKDDLIHFVVDEFNFQLEELQADN